MRASWRPAIAVLLSICLTVQPLQSVRAQEATPTAEPALAPTETVTPEATEIVTAVPTETAAPSETASPTVTEIPSETATLEPIATETPLPTLRPNATGVEGEVLPELQAPGLSPEDFELQTTSGPYGDPLPGEAAWHYGPTCTITVEGYIAPVEGGVNGWCVTHVVGEVVAFVLHIVSTNTDGGHAPEIRSCHEGAGCPVNHPSYRLWGYTIWPQTPDLTRCVDPRVFTPYDGWCENRGIPEHGEIAFTQLAEHYPNPSDNAFLAHARTGPTGYSTVTLTIQYILAGPDEQLLSRSGAVCPCDSNGGGAMDPRDSAISTAGGSQGWVGDPINAQNGAFSYNYVDLKVDTPAGPLQFQRHYESQFTGLYTGTLGYGWANNQDIRLIRPTDPGGEAGGIWFKGPGGNQYWFEGDATTAYTATAGVMATLAYSASGSPTYTLVDSAQSTYEFDANGRLTTWRDSLGRTFSYAYSSGLLSQISEPISGHSLSFTYDPGVPGRLQSVSDDTGRSVSYGFSGTTGDLTSVTDVRGQTWTYVYSGTTHLLTEVRDPDDTTTSTLTVDYDAQGRAFREWDGMGKKIVEITFNADGTSTVVDANGSTQIFTPSNQRLLGSVAKPLGSTIQMAYDDNLKPILITDPNGSQTALTWEGSGKNVNLTRVENDIVEVNSSLKQHVSFGYDALNNPTTIVDARGFTTTLGYSGTLLTSQTDALNRTSQFTYTDGSGSEPGGLLKTVQDPLGLTTVYTYNSAGQLITVSDPLGLTRAFTYDSLGRLATETGVDQLTNKYEYNAAGQVVTTTQNYLAGQGQNYQNLYNLITVNAYDDAGRLNKTTDTLGRSNWTCYDNANRVTKTVQNASGAAPCNGGYTPSSDSAYDRITVYTYDDAGNLIAATDPTGRITRTYYDALNRPTVIVQNLQGQAISVTTPPSYNPANPDQNVRTTTTYDAAGHVISTADNAGTLTQLCYDVIGRAVKSVQNATVSDPCGSYTASGSADRDLTTQTVYDANGNVIASVDAQGRITRTYYDALNRPEIVVSNLTDQAIEVTTPPTYSAAHPDQNLGTRTYYDEAGRAYRSQDLPTGQSAWTCFDNAGRVTKTVQNATGNPCGSFTPSTDPDKDIVTELRYDSLGRQIATIDPLGHITRTYYDAAGRVTATVQNLTGQSIDVGTPPAYDPAHPDQNVRFETTYDVLGRATTSVYGAGSAQAQTTRMCYDALGRTVKTVTNPSVSDPCGSYTPSTQTDRDVVQETVYDASGLAVASIDALGHIARTYYDGLGRPVVMVSNLVGQAISVSTPPTYNSAYPDRNVRQAVSYDAAGRTLDTTNNGGLVARQDYDLAGRVVTTTVNFVSGGAVDSVTNLRTVSTFDKGGNVIRSTDPKGVVTAFDYDGQGRAIQVIQNFLSPLARTNAQNVPTTYTFDSRGNRLTITDAMTHTTTLGYDLLGRPTTETDALSHAWTTVYNKLGQRVSMTDAKGQTVSFTYDGVGRLTGIDYPAGTADVTFTYDALGNQVGMADGTGSTSWSYDLIARPITITAPVVGAVAYTYDRLGNRTGLNAPGSKNTTYVYDALSRMTQAAGWASQTTTYGYGAFGQVVTATLPNGVTTSYGYDAAQRQTSIAHTLSSQTLASYTYTLDANGNRTRAVELVKGLTQGSGQSLPGFGSVRSGAVSTSGARTGVSGFSGGAAHGWLARWPAATSTLTTTIDYSYDNLARLTNAAYSDGTSFGYTYDGVGNRLTQTACIGSGCAPATTTFTYDNANRLATVNGVTYTYDANGNLTADGTRTYAYDAADRLTSLAQSGNTSTYAYNGQGDRVSQTVSGVTTRYTLDLASLYTQVLADGSTSYLYGLGRIGEQQTGGWAYHLTDALGSVRQLTTSAGAVSLARRFDPYGAPLTTAGSGSSIYGFTGEQTDPSGNVFLRARYYVPGIGRFLTRDTWAGEYAQPLTLNRWAYVNGNPINLVDPSGHVFQIAIPLVVIIVAVVVVYAIYAALYLSPAGQAWVQERIDGIDLPDIEVDCPPIPLEQELWPGAQVVPDIEGEEHSYPGPGMQPVQDMPDPSPDTKDDDRNPERDISLGLSVHPLTETDLLEQFTQNLNAALNPRREIYMWGSWGWAGLSPIDFEADPQIAFSHASTNASAIHFNLEGIVGDPLRFVENWGTSGWPTSGTDLERKYTAVELATVISRPELCSKTTFYENGSTSVLASPATKTRLCTKR